MTCPKCGYINSHDAPTCNLCHELLASPEVAVAERRSEERAAPLPRKDSAERYTLVFGARTGFGTELVAAIAGGEFPVPDFGDCCVCCGTPTREVNVQHVTTEDREDDASSVKVPMCRSCKPHAGNRALSRDFALGMLVFGVVLLIMGYSRSWSPFLWLGGGGLAIVAAIGWLISLEVSRRALAKEGHSTDLAIQAVPGQLTVSTRNEKLARHLVRANGEILHLSS